MKFVPGSEDLMVCQDASSAHACRLFYDYWFVLRGFDYFDVVDRPSKNEAGDRSHHDGIKKWAKY